MISLRIMSLLGSQCRLFDFIKYRNQKDLGWINLNRILLSKGQDISTVTFKTYQVQKLRLRIKITLDYLCKQAQPSPASISLSGQTICRCCQNDLFNRPKSEEFDPLSGCFMPFIGYPQVLWITLWTVIISKAENTGEQNMLVKMVIF